jgi:hypothetical protein
VKPGQNGAGGGRILGVACGLAYPVEVLSTAVAADPTDVSQGRMGEFRKSGAGQGLALHLGPGLQQPP